MAETIKEHDFIELEYTGKLEDGTVFDTTNLEVAKKNDLLQEGMTYQPVVICVGERQVLPGLDQKLIGKEVGQPYSIHLIAEEAFGKRDVKRVKIVPLSTFREHKVDPYPGLQIEVDGEVGIVKNLSGGRVIVNFNHPLAGKEVQYEIKVHRKITDHSEQVKSFLHTSFKIPADKIKVEVEEEKAKIHLPVESPEQFTSALGKRLAELTGLKEVHFEKNLDKKVEKKAPQAAQKKS